MNVDFEELAFKKTRLGELSLRRRTHVPLGVEVYEVKLGDEFLMSSLFTVGEIALATLSLADLGDGPLDVVVGGLGLGYTAKAVLEKPAVNTLVVVEALAEVVAWHEQGLLPIDPPLHSDPRCRLRVADFFSIVSSSGIEPEQPNKRYHAIMVDIDHSPRHVLHASHGSLYSREGLHRLAAHLHPCGVFGLWSNDPPDREFRAILEAAFTHVEAHQVTFPNPYQNRDASNTVYVARNPRHKPG